MKKNIAELEHLNFYNKKICGIALIMHSGNYVVSLGLRGFILKNPAEKFTLRLLRELYHDDRDTCEIDGEIHQVSFDKVKNDINPNLQCHPSSEYGDKIDLAHRLIYWKIVNQALDNKIPLVCYEHWPVGMSSFKGMMWDFCFILINGDTGIVLNGRAFD